LILILILILIPLTASASASAELKTTLEATALQHDALPYPQVNSPSHHQMQLLP